MLILGIDTSGRKGSVALLRAQDDASATEASRSLPLLTLDLARLSNGQYSELLVTTIAELLARYGVERSSIGLLAVASGPGSFTGLRISLATVKGLSEAFAIPVVAVSVLEAIALAAGIEGKVVAALDAQRSEVFFGEYNVASVIPEPARMDREALISFGNFTSLLASADPPLKVFTPDATLAARLVEAHFQTEVLPRPSADTFARIAYRKFLAGVRADVATLDANYLRCSDAEIFVAPKLGAALRY